MIELLPLPTPFSLTDLRTRSLTPLRNIDGWLYSPLSSFSLLELDYLHLHPATSYFRGRWDVRTNQAKQL